MPEVKDVQAAAPAQEAVQPAAPETPAAPPQASGEKAGGEGQAEDD